MSVVAVINAGSSSIKLAAFEDVTSPRLILRGHIDGIGVNTRMRLLDGSGATLSDEPLDAALEHEDATELLAKRVADCLAGRAIVAVGHRVVHGGPRHSSPRFVTAELLEELETFVSLAPLHQPHNLAPIRALRAARPGLPQVVCFDTAFHRTQPPVAQSFAIPRKYTDDGVRRYGFHGISYEYVAARLADIAPDVASKRVIIAHLGNGASLCAIQDGRSVASTMGFTAVDGLMMGTRSGALDPGVIIHLMSHYGLGLKGVEDLLYKQCGLLGVSGVSSDMRRLREADDPRAREAIDLFVYRIQREIGSLAAALGGLDALVFTAGIGENDAATRLEVARACAWIGVRIDEAKNHAAANEITGEAARVRTFIIPTNEELRIAMAVRELMNSGPLSHAAALQEAF